MGSGGRGNSYTFQATHKMSGKVMASIVAVLASIGVVQALLLSLFLITRKSADRAVRYFVALVLAGLSIRAGKSVFNAYFEIEPWQKNIGISGLLLVGPALWFAARGLLEKGNEHQYQTAAHFLPALLFVGLSYVIPNDGSDLALTLYLAILAHMLVYTVISIRQVHTHWQVFKEQKWFLLLVICIASLIVFYFLVFFKVVPYYIGGAVLYSLLVYSFSFMLFSNRFGSLKKYARSNASLPELVHIIDEMDKLMDIEKPFLEPSFSLEQAAAMLSMPVRNLSRAVNQDRKMNFSEYVNRFRVRYAQQLLLSPETSGLKIASIAMDAGFGNTATFNACFKKETGMTPSAFRATHGPN